MMVVLPNGLPGKRGEKEKDGEKEKEVVESASSVPPKLPPKPRAKPKVNLEQFLSAGGVVSSTAGGEMALVVRQRKLEKAYTSDSDRTLLYYTPSPPSTLPRQSRVRERPPPRLERELTNRASFSLAAPLRDAELIDWRMSPRGRDRWNSSQAYQSPGSPLSPGCGAVSKRRHSLDMGSSVALASDAAATVAKRYGAVSYAKRLSVIWTRRSQSLHGMLVQCASTTSTTSSTNSDDGDTGGGFGFQRGYIHAYNTTNSNSNAGVTSAKGSSSKESKREKSKEGKSGEELEESVV